MNAKRLAALQYNISLKTKITLTNPNPKSYKLLKEYFSGEVVCETIASM